RRCRTPVGPDEDTGMVEVEGVRRLVGALLADAEEPVHGALTVGAGNPAVRRSELELGRLGRGLHSVEGGEEGGGVDTIANGVVGDAHFGWSLLVGVMSLALTPSTN